MAAGTVVGAGSKLQLRGRRPKSAFLHPLLESRPVPPLVLPNWVDAVDKVVGVTGLVALAAAGLSWVVLVFIAPPGLRARTDATERHWHRNSRN